MKKKLLRVVIVLSIIFLISGCQAKESKTKRIEQNEVTSLKIIIHNEEYDLSLEDNKTTKELLELLPLELELNDLNHNEKYIYLDHTFSSDSYYPKHIYAGDVMLYGDNCLVIFYQSFDTSFSYTKIGHINHLPDLGSESIVVKIRRDEE